MTKIVSIGVELECGINEGFKADFFTKFGNVLHAQEKCDGSVDVCDYDVGDCEITMWVARTDISKLFEGIAFLYNAYGESFETNESCGMHIHFKLDDMRYAVSALSYNDFQTKFFEDYKKKFNNSTKYLKRLSNDYCRAIYNIQDVFLQLNSSEKGSYRYKAVNLNSFPIHGTVEFRILPYMETLTEFRNAVQWMIEEVESLLTNEFEIFSTIEVEKDNVEEKGFKICALQ